MISKGAVQRLAREFGSSLSPLSALEAVRSAMYSTSLHVQDDGDKSVAECSMRLGAALSRQGPLPGARVHLVGTTGTVLS